LGGWNPWVDRRAGKTLDRKKESWRPDMSVVKVVIKFVKTTGKLSTIRSIEELSTQERQKGIGNVV
jgi:hypothetical protein